MALTLELAERFIAGAKAKAQQQGWAMSLAVVDPAGNLVALARMDGARWLTAGGRGGGGRGRGGRAGTVQRASGEIGELGQTRPLLFGSIGGLTGRPLLLAGGGLPLVMKGELLGGVGASGGTEAQDIECARAGLTAIGGE